MSADNKNTIENNVNKTPPAVEVVEPETLRISVRNLVEFIFRSGDIDNRVGGGAQAEAMLAGSRIHRKIQKNMGSGYRSEVPLKYEVIMGHYLLSVEGRADGIFSEKVENTEDTGKELLTAETTGLASAAAESETVVFIDEIKGMYTDVTRFEEPKVVHLAQAKCYAYIFAALGGLDKIGVQITYCDLDSENLRRFREIYSFHILQGWFDDLIEAYRKWTDWQYEWRLARRDSIKALEFPFEYRAGQRKLVADVYRTFSRKKILFLQAPTGTGKTIATVFPAVKAMGEGLAERIFYLTAKTITRTVAKEAFDILKADGLEAKVLTITAREKICPADETDCNPESCPYAKGHYDRVNDAVYELMATEHDYSRETLLAAAKKHQVCPFEMALDLSLWSDVIICDYNYVFDPNVCLRRFFAEGEKGDYLFLIDEAHNLVERGREMYSATLAKEDFLKFKKIFKKYDQKIMKAMNRCNRIMLEWKRECEHYSVIMSIGNFAVALMQLMALMDDFMRHRPEYPERKDVTEFYFELRHFINMHDLMDENYVAYTDFDGDEQFLIHLYCVNPAKNLQECLDRSRSAVFFSATLLPIKYYKSLLSTGTDNYAVYADSIFPKKNRLLFVARDVSSLYTRRNLSEYQKIAEYIRVTAGAKQGNYIVFFPSYKFMQEVYDVFAEMNMMDPDHVSPDINDTENNFADQAYEETAANENDGKIEASVGNDVIDKEVKKAAGNMKCIMQSSNMHEAGREEFLSHFSESRDNSLVAFCVLGGIFSEGIDLTEDKLIGVLVVGTGLPQICSQREILKAYYNDKLSEENAGTPALPDSRSRGGEGFSYAYQYPGMNKVLQAAGRVIRTATDVGVIGLLDERFLRRDYKSLFPREWDDYHSVNLDTLPRLLSEFWNKSPEDVM
ncbi:MAG: ATP-dependent DNA helicase [Clostridiales bacterium]|nr:ATP-dependent DNA helicase [Clostridiales bacterium]